MTVTAIVTAAAGSRALVRTVDSLRRAGVPEVAIASHGSLHAGVAASLEARTGARSASAASWPAAVNAAAQRARGETILLVPAGCRVAPGCVPALCEALPAGGGGAAAPVPGAEAPRRPGAPPEPTDTSAAALVARPDRAPCVLVISSVAWRGLGGLDERAAHLAVFELSLRLAFARALRTVPAARAVCDMPVAGWPPPDVSDAAHLQALRYVIEKHQHAIAQEMSDVIVRREIAFGRLRDRHRALLARRDADLQALDELRAETAHARAWLAHRGLDVLDWGDLRRTSPVSRDWGYDRGGPLDRHYIEAFLHACSSDVRGAVLEVQEDELSRAAGGPRVERVDVIDLDDGNPRATVVADLRAAPHLASHSYDCIVLTQTLHVIDDMEAVLREARRLLKPAGTLLATVPCASRVCLEYGEDGDMWRATPAGARQLFERVFDAGTVETVAYGNVLANVAFLEGIGRGELAPAELDAVDPYFPALVGIRARNVRRSGPRAALRGAVLLYHRVAPDSDLHGLAIAPGAFEAHLAWLRTHCTVMPLNELLRTPAARLPERAVAITLDDGYLDGVETAAPALERAGLPATFFVTSAWLYEPGEYWWDLLERFVTHTTPLPPVVRFEAASGPFEVSTTGEDGRRAAHRTLHAYLVRATLADRDHVVRTLGQHAPKPCDARRPMVAEEIQRLARQPGISIGAHTRHHLSLADQPAEAARQEIAACVTALEGVLGARVEDVAYPYGAASPDVRAIVRRGWRWGVACGERGLGDPFDAASVPRIDAGVLDATALAARLEQVFSGRVEDRTTA